MIRDPFMLPMRFFGYIICGLLISILFGFDSGVLSGCNNEFALGDGKNMVDKFKGIIADLFENCAGLAFINMLGWFGGIFPVLLIFPTELNVFLQVCISGSVYFQLNNLVHIYRSTETVITHAFHISCQKC